MSISFTKMQGLGNAIVVVDGSQLSIDPSTLPIQQLADARFGIGFDQLMWLTVSNLPNVDFGCRIFNTDGSEAMHCGNGLRCVGRFVERLTGQTTLTVTVGPSERLIKIRNLDAGLVAVEMGSADSMACPQLSIDSICLGLVNLGNLHLVCQTDDLEHFDLERLGGACNADPAFPDGVNVGAVQVIDATHLKLRVYERGVGETLACGSGAVAAAWQAHQAGLVESAVKVELPGGEVSVSLNEKNSTELIGPAEFIFNGEISASNI